MGVINFLYSFYPLSSAGIFFFEGSDHLYFGFVVDNAGSDFYREI
jgi:hypothetical protein